MDPENTPARQGYAPPSYNQPAYAPPQYNQPAYAPPQYNQSAYVTGGTHKCKFCGLSFYSEGCKNSHERCCQGCSSDYYASGSEVDDSVSTEHANGSFNKIAKIRDDLLRCDKCGKNFTKLDDYLDHKSKGCYFHCTKCGDSFESFEDLDAHNESIHTVDWIEKKFFLKGNQMKCVNNYYLNSS